jgi:eight-cysteine-cluster-containing protein
MRLMIAVFAMMAISCCLGETAQYGAPTTTAGGAQCALPADCAGRMHPSCEGSWACAQGMCGWKCAVTDEPATTTTTAAATTTSITQECLTDSDCATGGCSGEVCTQKDKAPQVVTTCLMRPQYECLNVTSCGCVGGKCSWKDTVEYKRCLVRMGIKAGFVM